MIGFGIYVGESSHKPGSLNRGAISGFRNLPQHGRGQRSKCILIGLAFFLAPLLA